MDPESRAAPNGVVVSLERFRLVRRSRDGLRRPVAAMIPFKPKSSHGDAGLREAEGQLSFIDLALEVDERVAEEDGPERWSSPAAFEAQRRVRDERVARYRGEAEGARRYILDQPATGPTGAAVKLRMALSTGTMSNEAERLVRDALRAIAPPHKASTGREAAPHDGAA
jgi:hypothetical protein